MELNQEEIRKIILKTIYTEESTKELLILKGGQSLSIYNFSNRASYDIDFTIKESQEKVFERIEPILKMNLEKAFEEVNFYLFDYKFTPKPRERHCNLPPYWGGYALEFKLISKIKKEQLEREYDQQEKIDKAIRNLAIPFGKNNSTKVELEFSYHEYSKNPMEIALEGTTIKIKLYRPIIVVYEKIRALCQNIPGDHLPKNKRGRSRDLYDIYSIIFSRSEYALGETEVFDKENVIELKEVFKSKEVPLELLLKLEDSYELLKKDFEDTFILTLPEAEKLEFNYLYEFIKYIMRECYLALS